MLKRQKVVILIASVLGIVQGLLWIGLSSFEIVIQSNDFISEDTTKIIKDIHVILTGGKYTASFVIFLIFSTGWFLWSSFLFWAIRHERFILFSIALSGWSIITIIISIEDGIMTSMLLFDYMDMDLDTLDNTYMGLLITSSRGILFFIINIVLAGLLMQYASIFALKERRMLSVKGSIIDAFKSDSSQPANGQRISQNPMAYLNNNTETDAENGNDNSAFHRSQSFFEIPDPEDLIRYDLKTNSSPSTPKDITENNFIFAGDKLSKPDKPGRRSPKNIEPPTVPEEASIFKSEDSHSSTEKQFSSNSTAPFIPPPDYTPPSSPTPNKPARKPRKGYIF